VWSSDDDKRSAFVSPLLDRKADSVVWLSELEVLEHYCLEKRVEIRDDWRKTSLLLIKRLLV
jgi:hypothetical protein